ncbi:hypothetical protein J7T55_002228 [Diaporthe amygdali]|uniref:uncharacterized protein n=1 Tax=Phomopsis amygdali TaxID=1214568 RepID=UPI0022FDEDC7|nr:uncharacterized protein J7T55_002228 [Diaporthe amygdali]KAJ0109036.1 hypothetical protein J7T55_002228 [Diaporthe amygdali]
MAPARHTLRTAVPRAGFLWEPRSTVLRQEREDRAVVAALHDHGVLAVPKRVSGGNVCLHIERELAGMFDAACRAVDAEPDLLRGMEAFEFVGDHLWHSGVLSWARAGALEEELFINLFFEVYRRRLDWYANPREPFNFSDHGPLAHSVDTFHNIASDYWGQTDFEMWAMVHAPVIEFSGAVGQGNDPVAVAPHTLTTGALAVAYEGHPQMHHDPGGQDEEMDIEMGDTVEEMRERLARTGLGVQEDVEMKE